MASISHELRTPLTYIKGYADVVNRQDITESEVKEYAAIIREETEYLSVLIKTFLIWQDWTRADLSLNVKRFSCVI